MKVEQIDAPAPRLRKLGGVRPAASTAAVCMSETAVVNLEGVGLV